MINSFLEHTSSFDLSGLTLAAHKDADGVWHGGSSHCKILGKRVVLSEVKLEEAAKNYCPDCAQSDTFAFVGEGPHVSAVSFEAFVNALEGLEEMLAESAKLAFADESELFRTLTNGAHEHLDRCEDRISDELIYGDSESFWSSYRPAWNSSALFDALRLTDQVWDRRSNLHKQALKQVEVNQENLHRFMAEVVAASHITLRLRDSCIHDALKSAQEQVVKALMTDKGEYLVEALEPFGSSYAISVLYERVHTGARRRLYRVPAVAAEILALGPATFCEKIPAEVNDQEVQTALILQKDGGEYAEFQAALAAARQLAS